MSKTKPFDEASSDQPDGAKASASNPQPQQAMLLQRRQVLKAAALAAPLLVTLRARSVYAGGHHHSQMGSTGINYGPGAYFCEDDNEIHKPDWDKHKYGHKDKYGDKDKYDDKDKYGDKDKKKRWW